MLERPYRIRLCEALEASFSCGRTEGRGTVCDVSPGGFFLRSPVLLPPGQPVQVSITTPSGWRMSLIGAVCWNTTTARQFREPSGFGVRLTRHSDAFAGFVDGALAVLGPEAEDDLL